VAPAVPLAQDPGGGWECLQDSPDRRTLRDGRLAIGRLSQRWMDSHSGPGRLLFGATASSYLLTVRP